VQVRGAGRRTASVAATSSSPAALPQASCPSESDHLAHGVPLRCCPEGRTPKERGRNPSRICHAGSVPERATPGRSATCRSPGLPRRSNL
jgi:hypothetical protein